MGLAEYVVARCSRTYPVGKLELVQIGRRVGLVPPQVLGPLRHLLQEAAQLQRLQHQRAAHGPVVAVRVLSLGRAEVAHAHLRAESSGSSRIRTTKSARPSRLAGATRNRVQQPLYEPRLCGTGEMSEPSSSEPVAHRTHVP